MMAAKTITTGAEEGGSRRGQSASFANVCDKAETHNTLRHST